MNVSVRNGIVLENILPHISDVLTAMRLSAACTRWYEIIHYNNKLWTRLIQLEEIEDPEHWYRDDDEEQWELGAPCKSKNILINYKRTYYCLKNNIYKKCEFNFHSEDPYSKKYDYDGKTLALFTIDRKLETYKIITNNFELFQIIDVNDFPIEYVVTNSDYIVIKSVIDTETPRDLKIYRYLNNQYVCINPINLPKTFRFKDLKLIRSNTLMCYNTKNFIAYNIAEDRIILNLYNHTFIKYYKDILYLWHKDTFQIVLYNEKFQLVFRINKTFLHSIYIFDVISTADLVHIMHTDDDDDKYISISTCNKSTGQVNLTRKQILRDTIMDIRPSFLGICNNIMIVKKKDGGVKIFDSKFRELWSYPRIDYIRREYYYLLFNKLIVWKMDFQKLKGSIDFIDVNNGKILFTRETFFSWNFNFYKTISILGNAFPIEAVLLYS